ncbi:DNA-directed RNA polymerase V subunit 5C-like [Cornus florida]|uniref:DNA-directed RNA polymerase V subunit 5C-like n=1 Tax=Cornus florida TaxID=4283 RepID=UPI002896EF76|nr:DNA-directed RNA polymerase V subunit 5C-like [Cornus florida]
MYSTGGTTSGCGGKPPCITSFVDYGSVESHRYYLARRTVLEMLRDRGYVVSDAELTISLTEFRSIFTEKPDLERLRFCVSHGSKPSKKVLVIFCGTEEIRKQDIVGILSQIANKDSLHRVLLILQNKMNPYARKVVDEYPIKVETFKITDLLVNVTKHVLEPKYEILTTEEKQKVLEKYKVEDKQLPRMLEDDAIARYYGLEKGSVVKVTSNGAITDLLVTYRCIM